MAKKKAGGGGGGGGGGSGGDSNTGLIVTLIFFVLATLTLGVFTYFGYDGQKELASKAKQAAGDVTKANSERDLEAMKRIILAVATGNDAPGEQAKLAAMKDKPEFAAATASVKDLKWDGAQNRFTESYIDAFARLRKEKEEAERNRVAADKSRDEATLAYATQIATMKKKMDDAETAMKKAEANTVAAKKEEQTAYATLIGNTVETLSTNLSKEKQDHADSIAKADRDQKKSKERDEELKNQIVNLQSRTQQPNSLEADTPKGRVLRIDRDAGLAYINLGSADYLRPGTTFSVLPANATTKTASGRERKGTLEVVAVLDAHLSSARISEVANPLRDPPLKDDLIYNPSWNSSQREHVALAGIFDIDGDGRDDTEEVVRNLERQGIIVDAWYDIRERTLKGPGLTERTSFLVLGEKPQLSDSIAKQTGQAENPITQAVIAINLKLGELETKAKDKGVQKVAYRRYLTLIGYPMPKVTRPFDPTITTYLGRTTGGETKPDENKADDKKTDDKKADEKKPDEKKD